MQDLFDIIYAAYAAGGAAILLSALYNTEAPPDAEFPYAVMQVVNSKTDDFASNRAYTDNTLIQFNFFDKRSKCDHLLAAVSAFKVTFDFAALGAALSCVRENTLQSFNDGIWQINVTYRIKWRSP